MDDLVNMTAMNTILKTSNLFKILLVVSANEIQLNQGKGFVKVLTFLSRMFTKQTSNKDILTSFIQPVITKFVHIKERKVIDDALEKIRLQLEEMIDNLDVDKASKEEQKEEDKLEISYFDDEDSEI